MIKMKRVYETPSKNDGFRVLVDRLWPRGLSSRKVRLNTWLKELAPSTDLRKSFAHDPTRWKDFQSRYKKELKAPEAKVKISFLLSVAKKRNLTLVYGARDTEHNNAVVLKKVLEKGLKNKYSA